MGRENGCTRRVLIGGMGQDLPAQVPRAVEAESCHACAVAMVRKICPSKPWAGMHFDVMPDAAAIFHASVRITTGDGANILF
jgi:hypothetical protein